MSQGWTAEACLKQLLIAGVRLSLAPGDNLKVTAPADLDLGPMLPVIRKYKPGLIRILRQSNNTDAGSRPKTASQIEREQRLLAGCPPAVQAIMNAIRAVFADVGGLEVVGVRDERDSDPSQALADLNQDPHP